MVQDLQAGTKKPTSGTLDKELSGGVLIWTLPVVYLVLENL